MNTRGVDFVMYLVSDLARAAAFYRDVLGLKQMIFSEEYQWAEFDGGNVTLALKGGEQIPPGHPGNRLALAVDDLQAAFRELKHQGVRILNEPADHGCCQHADVLDPDGNLVILHHRADGTWGQAAGDTEADAAAIIALERAALDRWGRGDPSGILEHCAPDVTYFDNTLDRRLDGLPALSARYEQLRGQIHLDRYEMLDTKVQPCGEAAVLTYIFVGHVDGRTSRWNCTEVYRRTSGDWCIIQTHWSPTQPDET